MFGFLALAFDFN